MDLNKAVVIESFGDEMKAQSVLMYLESCGVETILRKDDCGGMRPHISAERGVEILVSADDVPRAREILNLMKSEELSDPSVTVNTKGIFSGWSVFVAGLIIGVLAGIVGVYVFGHIQVGEFEAVSNSVKVDRNNDSVTDAIYYYGKSGELIASKEDNNFDGEMDFWGTCDHGFFSEAKQDTDFNGEWDTRTIYIHGVIQKTDCMPNGSDIIVRRYLFENGIFRRELIDVDRDGIFDVEKDYDPFGGDISTKNQN